MTYSVARLIDPYRGLFQIIETTDDYEIAWCRAGAARERCPEQIFIVMSTDTREDPKLGAKVLQRRE